MPKKRIGVLTGGGDVPDTELRDQIGGLPRAGLGCEALGICRVWKGLTHVDLNDPARTRQLSPH
jgi:ATP-dependent phosphofructokinase / diphosphate-dependent phosphofructokinase